MKLLVDIGNSRVKWAVRSGDELTGAAAFTHAGDPDATAFAVLDHFGHAPDSVLVSNVAGRGFADAIASRVRERWNLETQFAATQANARGVRNAYADHAKLGVDRWLAMLAAADRFSRAICVVDAGTALTIDLVEKGGQHLGGYIVPGRDLMWRALTGDTGDLGRFTASDSAGEGGSLEPGRDTGDAIRHGSLTAICALIECCAARLAEDNRGRVVVVTGGDAGRIIPFLAVDLEHRPQLVLEGLALWKPG